MLIAISFFVFFVITGLAVRVSIFQSNSGEFKISHQRGAFSIFHPRSLATAYFREDFGDDITLLRVWPESKSRFWYFGDLYKGANLIKTLDRETENNSHDNNNNNNNESSSQEDLHFADASENCRFNYWILIVLPNEHGMHRDIDQWLKMTGLNTQNQEAIDSWWNSRSLKDPFSAVIVQVDDALLA